MGVRPTKGSFVMSKKKFFFVKNCSKIDVSLGKNRENIGCAKLRFRPPQMLKSAKFCF